MQSLKHPFYNREVPIILGEHVNTEAGTGCVHTDPDHGVEDFMIAGKYEIKTLNYINDNGVFNENVEEEILRKRLEIDRKLNGKNRKSK